jgi:hypothetical protein
MNVGECYEHKIYKFIAKILKVNTKNLTALVKVVHEPHGKYHIGNKQEWPLVQFELEFTKVPILKSYLLYGNSKR